MAMALSCKIPDFFEFEAANKKKLVENFFKVKEHRQFRDHFDSAQLDAFFVRAFDKTVSDCENPQKKQIRNFEGLFHHKFDVLVRWEIRKFGAETLAKKVQLDHLTEEEFQTFGREIEREIYSDWLDSEIHFDRETELNWQGWEALAREIRGATLPRSQVFRIVEAEILQISDQIKRLLATGDLDDRIEAHQIQEQFEAKILAAGLLPKDHPLASRGWRNLADRLREYQKNGGKLTDKIDFQVFLATFREWRVTLKNLRSDNK